MSITPVGGWGNPPPQDAQKRPENPPSRQDVQQRPENPAQPPYRVKSRRVFIEKLRYFGLLVGTIVGLILGWSTTLWERGAGSAQADFERGLAIPLGIIGYAIGAMIEPKNDQQRE